MNFDEAKRLILRHADPGPTETPATLLESLRPYRGIQEQHFLELLEAFVTVAPKMCTGAKVDREIVHALWDLCYTARAWTLGPHEPMFHGPKGISVDEKKTLDEWIFIIESSSLRLLRGLDIPSVFSGLAWHVNKYRWGDRAAFLAPVFLDTLAEQFDADYFANCSDYDDYLCLCEALASMPKVSKETLAVLRDLPVQCAPSLVQVAVRQAISQLSS